jgi:predicted amidohydrolase
MKQPRTIKTAAIQLSAAPAPTAVRLQRAEREINTAVAQGAQLILLPELFNTGYSYTPLNHHLAEPLDGPTGQWLKQTATQHQIHLGGSFLLLDEDEVYNALILVAPDGRLWRYDKQYPWAWERGYFRDGNRITIAHTDLGDIGMMICWDTAHRELWARYAGRVDLMLIASCPPNPAGRFIMPDGRPYSYPEIAPLLASHADDGPKLFGQMIDEQTAWLGVPTVHTVGVGTVRTPLPQALPTLLTFALQKPDLLRYLPNAPKIEMETEIVSACKIVAASGKRLAERSAAEGEGCALATITLSPDKPQPTMPQPPSRLGRPAYWLSDVWLAGLTIPVYRQGLRAAHGERMAPVDSSTSRWAILLLLVGFLGFWLGRRR